MFSFISCRRHAPLWRFALGAVLFITGMFILTRIMWAAAAAYMLWGAISGITRMRAARRAARDGTVGARNGPAGGL